MVEFRATMDEDALDVVVNGVRRASLQRHEGRPRLQMVGVDTGLTLDELSAIESKLRSFTRERGCKHLRCEAGTRRCLDCGVVVTG